MYRRFCNDTPIDCARLIPSAIVCLCGDRFDSDWTNNNASGGSALCLYLAHQASAIASLSTIIKPHRVVCTLVSCVLCTQSVGVDHYRAHFAECRRDGERLDKYCRLSANHSTTQFASPFFSCSACLDEGRFVRHDVGTILEHEHDSAELYVTCRVCASDVAVDNALGHAAFAHRERLESTTVADMFIIAPTMRSLPRSADSDSYNTFSPVDNDETTGVAPDRHHQMLDVHQLSPTRNFEVHRAKCEPSDDSLVVDDQSRATFDLPNNHYLAEQIFTEQLVDALCEIDAKPTTGSEPPSRGNLTDAMSSAPIETVIQCELAMQCPRQATSTAGPNGTVRELLFECDECGQKFVTRRSWTTHLRKHPYELLKKEVRPHECNNCGRRCTTARDLQLHEKTHTVESSRARKLLFECDECGVTFSRGVHLRRHQSTHDGERPFAYSDCGRCFIESSHIRSRTHTGESPFTCSDCGKCFTRSNDLKKHRVVHTGERPFPCTDCGKCFTNSGNLRRHRFVHTGERRFTCSDCGKRFAQSGNLKAHRFVHTGETPFPCTVCGKCFARSADLKKHRFIHTGERPFTCSDCGKRFAQSGDLKKHRVIHTGERPFACSDCGKRFAQSGSLNAHRFVHTGERPFTCSDCGKRFARSNDLKKHRFIHTGERPFACSECGKRFTRSSHLKAHRVVHTGEGPFACSDCGKCFADSGILRRHRFVHIGERRFTCSDCGKRFARSGYLKAHRVVHTGERPFPCTDCGKCFARSDDLKKHRFIHTGERPFACSECGKRFTRSTILKAHHCVHTGERRAHR